MPTKGSQLNSYGASSDIIVLMAFGAITLTITMAFPLVIFPCRFTLDVMLFGSSHNDMIHQDQMEGQNHYNRLENNEEVGAGSMEQFTHSQPINLDTPNS